MFERDVVILDYQSNRDWPEAVRQEVKDAIERYDYAYGNETYHSIDSIFDEEDEALGWTEEGVPLESPLYKWLLENNVDYRKCYLHFWW